MARDPVYWRPCTLETEHWGKRKVYIKHWWAPFAGYIAAADTAFSIPAYIVVRGRRLPGFITPGDGMAYMQEHGASVFVGYGWQGPKQPTAEFIRNQP